MYGEDIFFPLMEMVFHEGQMFETQYYFWDHCVEIEGLSQQRHLKHDPNTVELIPGS